MHTTVLPFIFIYRYLLSVHWLKINERIEYKLLSLTYNILTTSRPDYLHNLISVQSLNMHHITCEISSLLHSVNLILCTLLLIHLILRISPHLAGS